MAVERIETRLANSDRVCVTNYDFGDGLDGLKKLLLSKGVKDVDAVIFSHAKANMMVAYRSGVKILMKKTDPALTDVKIDEKRSAWVPGLAPERGTPATKEKRAAAYQKDFESMSVEEQDAEIAKLKQLIVARKKAQAGK